MKRAIFLVIALLGYNVIALTGCASLKEGAKCVLGTSTQELEEGRIKAVTKKFNLSASDCYAKVLNAVTIAQHYVYAKDINKMIAIYVSSDDTTAAGIFFNEIDANNTEVQISSPSTFVKEVIAKEVFAALEQPVVSASAKEEVPVEVAPTPK